MSWLKQSTAATVPMGPFVDDTDFKTVETALSLTQAETRLSKNGAAFAQKTDATTASHMEEGSYGIVLDATDTNTLGRLRIQIQVAGALIVWQDFMVLPANVWDSLFGADKLQVHADEITAGLITAAAIAADAITDAKVAADVTIASVTGAVGSVTSGVTVTTNNDKTGYGLSAAAVQAIWDALTAALTTVGSIGKLLVDNINATISSRLATAGYTAPPTAAAISDQVWDEATADHAGAGTTGKALTDAGSAGDPWATALPGAYGAGTAGKIIGDNVNATVSSRSSHSAADVWASVARTLTAATNITSTGGTTVPQTGDSFARVGAPAGVSLAADVAAVKSDTAAILIDTAEIGVAGAGLTAIGAVGSVTGAVGSVTGAVGSVTGLTAADVGAIKTKTDSLTFTVAGQVDANIQAVNDVALVGDGSVTPWGPA